MGSGARVLTLHPELSRLLDAVSRHESSAVADFDEAVRRHPPSLEVEVLSTKRVPAGSGVSYGHTHITAAETTLALVAVGYGHGLPRKAGNRCSATWVGPDAAHSPPIAHPLPIIGRVAMDVLVVDGGSSGVAAGGSVTVFGDPRQGATGIVEWAAAIDEDAATLLACLHRVRVVTTP